MKTPFVLTHCLSTFHLHRLRELFACLTHSQNPLSFITNSTNPANGFRQFFGFLEHRIVTSTENSTRLASRPNVPRFPPAYHSPHLLPHDTKWHLSIEHQEV